MAAPYRVKLMFEWGGGVLWPDNDAARDAFGVGAIEDCLPVSPSTRARLEALSEWHDTALNWDYPPDPGPWTEDEEARFEAAADDVLAAVRVNLGPDYEVVYRRL